jgi:hypothetical protein
MAFIDLVVALYHIQHICPSICQIFKLVPLDIILERVLKKKTVIELDVKVDGCISKIAYTEGNNSA